MLRTVRLPQLKVVRLPFGVENPTASGVVPWIFGMRNSNAWGEPLKRSVRQKKSMRFNGSGEMTSKASGERPDGFLGLLRAVALIVVLAGTGGSVGLMLRAGRNAPRLLLVLFTIWVLCRLWPSHGPIWFRRVGWFLHERHFIA